MALNHLNDYLLFEECFLENGSLSLKRLRRISMGEERREDAEQNNGLEIYSYILNLCLSAMELSSLTLSLLSLNAT